MKTVLVSPFALAAAAFLFHANGPVQAQIPSEAEPVPFTAEELENLLAPVALYPDPILAQVLIAASYPEEVDLAAHHVSVYGDRRIDEQPWDISVKAVAHYEPVLNLMADRLDWTTALGQAYAEQPEDVMVAVQSLRRMARAHGNLVTTEQHEVVVEDRYIRILPAQPRVVYVPVYDPFVVYHRPVVHLGVYRSGWSFGVGFPIGVWLVYDLDWRRRHVFYHGWDHYVYGTGWIPRSRPFVVINRIYVHPRPIVVVVNRRVIHRPVDFRRFTRYNTVHRHVAWERHAGRRYAGRAAARVGDSRANPNARNPSWDRSGRTRVSEADRRAVARSRTTSQPQRATPQRATPQRMTPQRGEQRPPSWDRADRIRSVDRNTSSPSLDRSARTRSNSEERAATRPAATPRQPRTTPERAAPPQRQRSETRVAPQRGAQQRAAPRTETRRAPRTEMRQIDTRPVQLRTGSSAAAPQRVSPRSPRERSAQVRSNRTVPQTSSRPQADRSPARGADARRSAPSRSGRSSATPSRNRSGRGGGEDGPSSS